MKSSRGDRIPWIGSNALCLLFNTKISLAIACVDDERPTRGSHTLRGTRLAIWLRLAPNKASYQQLYGEIGWAGISRARERTRKIFPDEPCGVHTGHKVRSCYSCQGRNLTHCDAYRGSLGNRSIESS